MLGTIDFNDQLCLIAKEIRYIGSYHFLSAKPR